jgi:hypothetical protein
VRVCDELFPIVVALEFYQGIFIKTESASQPSIHFDGIQCESVSYEYSMKEPFLFAVFFGFSLLYSPLKPIANSWDHQLQFQTQM